MRNFSLRPVQLVCALTAPFLAACENGAILSVGERQGVQDTVPELTARENDLKCLEPSKVRAGVLYRCADGTQRTGTLLDAEVATVSECSLEGETGCIASDSHPAVVLANIAPSSLRRGFVVAGVTGTFPFSGPANCAAEGEAGCLLTSAFAAASTNGLAAKVVAGQSVAGVAGSAPARPADCALDGATGCVSTVGFPAVNLVSLTPSVLKKNVTVAGVTGDYPSAAFPLSGAHGATADLTSLSSNTAAGAYEFFDSAGTRYTGSISDAGSISVGTTSQTFNASLYRAFTVPGDANLVAGNISSGVSILGVEGSAAVRPGDCSTDGAVGCVTTATHKSAIITGLAAKVISTTSVAGETGTVVLPGASDVRLNVAYGPGSGSTGSYSPDFPDVANVSASDTVNGVSGTLSSCTMDGDTGCMVPASGSIKAADTSNFTGWDIRKKRNPSTGAVLTFAGLQTQNKTCRNTANRAVFNNTTAPADSAGVGVDSPDFFDTIDDNNNNLTGLPGEIPAWSIINSTNYSTDFACGGIYATGDTTSGNTGADGAVAHNPNGNWQDLTPGILPGGANSSNTANGCNATDKHCVFRELISGLLVTEVSAGLYNFHGAISYCHNLGEAGGVVTSPIPIIGGASYSDWRLPTQKELMHLYSAGIRSLNQTASLQTTFGNVSEWFWSSTSGSGSGNAFEVNISRGSSTLVTRDEVNPLVCVR